MARQTVLPESPIFTAGPHAPADSTQESVRASYGRGAQDRQIPCRLCTPRQPGSWREVAPGEAFLAQQAAHTPHWCNEENTLTCYP